jgi:hypothetical protein
MVVSAALKKKSCFANFLFVQTLYVEGFSSSEMIACVLTLVASL